jgi:CRP/FNR family cyclic AMP-dependent transcriptional regulator
MEQAATMHRPASPAVRSIHAGRDDERVPARGDTPVRFHSGDELYREGEGAGAIFVLLAGRVRLSNRAGRGAAMMTGLLRPGALFGVDSLSEDVYGETAGAETDCLVRIVPVAVLDILLRRQPGFAAGLMEALIRRRTAAEGLLTRALLTGVPGRLAGALLDAAEGGTVTGRTRRQLAEAAWTTRETATRMLFHFVEDGLVRVNGRSIDLLDQQQLRLLAGGVRRATAA